MDLLYLAHCVPNPPDKGERIRAFYQLNRLVEKHRVHLVCFARSDADERNGRALEDRCASVYVERHRSKTALSLAAAHFGLGGCLTTSFYASRRMREHVRSLAGRVPLGASIIYSSAMAPYVPDGVPFLLDLVDVDSEKWIQYARTRFPGFAYRMEGGRLRRVESNFAKRSQCTYLSTHQELTIFQGFAPEAPAACMENGVDFERFDPSVPLPHPELRDRSFLVFVGAMEYFPNVDGVCWFAREVFPKLRRQVPGLEFFVVGRDPTPAVLRLNQEDGVTVTGAVDDIRPYAAAARAVVAPLRIARGIQNKVLEGLAMGKPVFASSEICQTFAPGLPAGVIPCPTPEDFVASIAARLPAGAHADSNIREAAKRRFSWSRNLDRLSGDLEALAVSSR
ncbi:MAG: TIGR03087 family PEP-CTERM/XrtA system glycosyltransferase [Bryobacteraceae bacterium]